MANAHDTSGDLPVELAGEQVVLLPERALWWPAQHCLLVADVHFGKSSVFRASGLAVPAGSTDDNIARLSACIERYSVARLLCLGDLTHARSGHTAQVTAKLRAFREKYPDLKIELVRGNHDRHAGVPEVLRATVRDEPLMEPPFHLCHTPLRMGEDIAAYVIAGHVHPAIILSTQQDRLRVPCFVLGERSAVLPAFGAFTGMHTLDRLAGVRYYPALEDRVLGPIIDRGPL